MTRDAKLRVLQVPFLASLVLMLIPSYRAHAAGVPAVTSTRVCYYFANWQYSGSSVVCWGAAPPTNCIVCQ